jgi:elongation factor P hydroxylase
MKLTDMLTGRRGRRRRTPTRRYGVDALISAIKEFDRLMFSLSGGLGTWIAPVTPSVVYGHTFYASSVDELGAWAIVGGVSIACGLVVAGATSSHTAIALKSAGAPADKVRACWALVIAYVILEIGGILAMSSLDHSIAVVGVTASLLTLVVYLSRSYTYYLKEFKAQMEETKVEEQSDKKLKVDFQIEQARLNAEAARQEKREQRQLKQQIELARIAANKEKAIAKSKAKFDVTSGVTNVTQNVTSDVTPNVTNGVTNDVTKGPSERRDAILRQMLHTPNVTQKELALRFNVTRQTIGRDIRALLNGVSK